MSSFLYMCACTMPHTFFYDSKFYFPLRQLVAILVSEPSVVLWLPREGGGVTTKGVFHQRLSSTKGHLPPKVVFHRRLSSTKGCLPPTITPWLILYLWEQSTYQISASYLQCMKHDAWCLRHDAWCMMHDAWCVMHDAWCMMHYAWCMMLDA